MITSAPVAAPRSPAPEPATHAPAEPAALRPAAPALLSRGRHADPGDGACAMELASALATPRLLNITVTDADGKATFLPFVRMAGQGEEVAAVTRIEGGAVEKVKVTGTHKYVSGMHTIQMKTVAAAT